MNYMLEKEIQKSILQYLSLKRVFHWRNNSGALQTQHGGFIRFGAVGSPDIFVIKKGICFGLECKTKKGRLSDGQLLFSEDFAKAGGVYCVVRSLDDVISLGL